MQQEERCGHSRQSAFLSKSTASGVCRFLQVSDTCQFWPSQRSTVNSQCLFTFTVCRPRQCLRTLLVHTHSLSPQAVSKQIACSHPQSVVQTVSTYIPCSHPQSVALECLHTCLFTTTVCRPRQCLHTLFVHTHNLSPQTVSTYSVC